MLFGDNKYSLKKQKAEPNNPVGQFGYFPFRISFKTFISSSKLLHSANCLTFKEVAAHQLELFQ